MRTLTIVLIAAGIIATLGAYIHRLHGQLATERALTTALTAANTALATLKGATLQTAHDWGFMRLTAVFDFLDARDDSTGQRLNRRATHQASIGADYLADRWSTGATFTRVGSRPDGNVRLGSYAVLDLRADWKLDTRWKLEAKLLNALDRDIEPVRDYQGLGRQFWLGVRVDTSI